MRILIVSQYFWPESFTINHLASTLRDQGHNIVVVTGKPNYPDGKIFEGYRSSGINREIYDRDIELFRVPLRPRGKSGALNLLRNYFSFVWSGLRWFPFLLKGYEFDAILVFAGSPNVAIPALPLKWIKKAHLALWILDLWPESLAATGFIRNRVILRLVAVLVKWTYYCADTILVQSKAFLVPVSCLTRPDKVVYYANSVDISKPDEKNDSSVPSELLEVLKSHFCIVFTGNIGTAQSIDTLVNAASYLKDLSNVRIVLVGSGSMSNWVNEIKDKLKLDNLIVAGRFPMSAMPIIFKHSAGLVATLKNEEIFSYTIPGKIQSYLAAGRPIIAAINGEGARIVTESGAGLTCIAEDSLSLANCVRILYAMSEEDRIQMGVSGNRYFLQNFEIKQQASRLVEILEQRIKVDHSIQC
ncbi:MAG: glycosyltransferase family 4 protein [Sediminibacterium sp.]|nr:glycosyltransferase family 4 protein [Sediminibacterium sp.]